MWKKLISYLKPGQTEEAGSNGGAKIARSEAELLADLAGTNKAKQAAAIEELGELQAEAALPGLVQALASSDLAVVLAGVDALRKFPALLTLPLVLPTLDNPEMWPPARTREVVVSYGVSVVPAIAASLAQATPEAKPHLLEMLGELAVGPDLHIIREALESEFRLAAARAVMKVAGRVPEARELFEPGLKALLNDQVPQVRAQVLEDLFRLDLPEKTSLVAKALLDEDRTVRTRAADLYNEESEIPREIWQIIGKKQLQDEDKLAIEQLTRGV